MTVKALRALPLLLLLSLIFGAAQEASSTYYMYKDSNGTICITNVRKAVPPKYRRGMVVIRDKNLAEKDHAGQKQAQPTHPVAKEPPGESSVQSSDAPAQKPGRFGELAARYRWFKPLVIIFGIFIVFMIVAKLSAWLSSPQLARILYISFFLGVFVFLYISYADYVVDSYFNIKQKIVTMFKKANEREKIQIEEDP